MEEPQHLGRPLRVVGRYALYGKLASGGMATVHFGRLLGPAGFSRTVAIKRLHPQFAKDPEFVAMFLDEARLAARIQHPNVVATVDVVARADELFLVMDYIRGESFSRLLRASRKRGIEVTLGVISSVTSGLLQGLHAAHEVKDEHGQPLSVVHRDVSPQNVLVGADGVTRVIDFGVAKAAARVQVTRDGQMKGKLSYMAPEQLLGKGVDRRTDIFAAGIVLWEALTGKRLFDAEEASEVLRMILKEELPPPSAVVPSIPREIDAVVMKALMRDPSLRYPTTRAFAIALEQVTPLASTREVGEWVEIVAGDTLLNRENTVAEIEAVSAVSSVSLVTESSPGFTKTLDGRVPQSVRQLVREIEDGPPKIVGAPPASDNPTRVHVPRPSVTVPSIRSKPPPPPPRRGSTLMGLGDQEKRSAVGTNRHVADRSPKTNLPAPAKHGFDEENEKTGIFDPTKHGFDEENEKTGIFDPTKHGFDEENEKTGIFDPAKHGFDEENEKTGIFDPTKHGFEEEDEKTGIFDPSRHDLGAPDSASRALEPTRPRNTKPPPLETSAPRTENAPTILFQEHTDPAFRRPGGSLDRGVAWLWADPSHRAVRVALVAGALALFGGFGIAASRSKTHGTGVATRGAPVSTQSGPLAASSTVAAPAPEEPHGIDPASLPPAAPDEGEAEPARHVAAHSPSPAEAPQRVEPVAVAVPPRAAAPPPTIPVVGTEIPSKPPVKVATKAPPRAAPEPSAEKPAEVVEKAAPPAPKPEKAAAAAAPKPAADCSQPYAIDANGIRRIKPECL